MSKYSEWAEALTIFAKYGDDDYSVIAEHDIVYSGHDIDGMSAEDIARLNVLGWNYDEYLECWTHNT